MLKIESIHKTILLSYLLQNEHHPAHSFLQTWSCDYSWEDLAHQKQSKAKELQKIQKEEVETLKEQFQRAKHDEEKANNQLHQ